MMLIDVPTYAGPFPVAGFYNPATKILDTVAAANGALIGQNEFRYGGASSGSELQKAFASASTQQDLELTIADLTVKLDSTTSATSFLRLKSVPAALSVVVYFSNLTLAVSTRKSTLTDLAFSDPDPSGATEASIGNNESNQYVVATASGMYEITVVRGASSSETYLSVIYIPA